LLAACYVLAGALTLILGHDRTAEAIDPGADQPSATARQRVI